MIIGTDFDSTVVEHRYPHIGPPVPGAIETLRELVAGGHKLVLWTVRSGSEFAQAVAYLYDKRIELYGRNRNPTQYEWSKSPKAFCDLYIDDAACGCPLIQPEDGRQAYVDWSKIREMLDMEPLTTK